MSGQFGVPTAVGFEKHEHGTVRCGPNKGATENQPEILIQPDSSHP